MTGTNGYQQGKAGGADRLADDQGGHLIASIFNGPGEKLNLTPMNGNFNMGARKSMENKLAKALEEGKSVDVKIEVVYGEKGMRADYFAVEYKIDGGRPVAIDFKNAIGGK